jgi:ribosome maturation factor RimP
MLSENYTLDVSSPGMSNPLVVPRQYKRRIGRTFDIVKTDGTALELILEAADDTTATFKTIVKVKKKKKGQPEVAEELPQTLVIPYSQIKKALIQIKW